MTAIMITTTQGNRDNSVLDLFPDCYSDADADAGLSYADSCYVYSRKVRKGDLSINRVAQDPAPESIRRDHK